MRSALVLLAPAVDESLRPLRRRHLGDLQRRMPAHVTALFPFGDGADPSTVAAIERVCAMAMPFDATFARVGRFGTTVVWLRPEPDAAIRAIIDAVLAAFPDRRPYSGQHDCLTPHLSVGSRLAHGVADTLAAEVVELLPLHDRIDAMSLMVETAGGWRHERSWPLGDGAT